MIITRSPLRISIGGGGTDLPSYYLKYGGFCISAAIDKYVYVSVAKRFVEGFLLKYSCLEFCEEVDKINHPIIRESLKLCAPIDQNLEISSMADIPAGTGLGSSGSFTTALLKALHTHKKLLLHPAELAEQAFWVESGLCGEPVGKQDQYISVWGGLTCFTFQPNGNVISERLAISEETYRDLEDNLLLFFTGYSRTASCLLREQNNRTEEADTEMVSNLHQIKDFGYMIQKALEAGDTRKFASLMFSHWYEKRQRSGAMSNQFINESFDLAMQNGALGGKLVGAGGGGFLLFYADDKDRLRGSMKAQGLREVRFRFEPEGTKVMIQ